jgi:hypothetical protein
LTLVEVDALVVHAAAKADGGGLRLGGVEVVAVVDVDDGAAVGDDVALEVPLAAKLVLQQELVGAGGLAVDGVVGAHDGVGVALGDGGAEGGQVGVFSSCLLTVDVGGVAGGLGAAVHGEVLGSGDDAVVAGSSPCMPVTKATPMRPVRKGSSP